MPRPPGCSADLTGLIGDIPRLGKSGMVRHPTPLTRRAHLRMTSALHSHRPRDLGNSIIPRCAHTQYPCAILVDVNRELGANTAMQITLSDLNNAKVMICQGRMDAGAASEVDLRYQRLVEAGATVVIMDLTLLDYLSSAGLRSILSAGKNLKARQGTLVLVAPSGPARQIIELAGFDKLFPICAKLEDAGRYTTAQFLVHVSQEWEVDILTVYGRVDNERAPELEAAGRRILEAGHRKLVINLSAVQYLSSAGLRALISLGKTATARNGRVILCNPSPIARQILELGGLDQLFPILPTVDEALVA
jgi:anti-anti-sigma factor